jgi:RNA polymerase sigma-70 factor (sigma-E family)
MGPDRALEQLMADDGDRLLRFAFQLTHDRQTAEDVVQDALVAIFRSWRRRMPVVEHVYAYARRAVINEFLQRQRVRSGTELVVSSTLDAATVAFADAVLDRDALWRAVEALPPRQRAVIVLRHYEDLSDADIAHVLGIRAVTVRSLAHRALAALRDRAELIEGGMP